MGTSVESSPKLADIDGDGVRDVIAPGSEGTLHVFSMRSGVFGGPSGLAAGFAR